MKLLAVALLIALALCLTVRAALVPTLCYLLGTHDSVLVMCDGQVRHNLAGDHQSTTGQSFSYACGPGAPKSKFTMKDHDEVLIKCNGGDPHGNHVSFALSLGQQAVVYCVTVPTVAPTP
jgi:hypothetical protein